MSRIVSKTIIKSITWPLFPCYYVILCFRGQSPTFLSLGGIKLKLVEWSNSEMLISCFMSILPNKMNLIKIIAFYVILAILLYLCPKLILWLQRSEKFMNYSQKDCKSWRFRGYQIRKLNTSTLLVLEFARYWFSLSLKFGCPKSYIFAQL